MGYFIAWGIKYQHARMKNENNENEIGVYLVEGDLGSPLIGTRIRYSYFTDYNLRAKSDGL